MAEFGRIGHLSRGVAVGQPLVSVSSEGSEASCTRAGCVVSGCTPLGRPAPEFPAVGRDCSLSPSLTSIGGRGAPGPARCQFIVWPGDPLFSRLQTRPPFPAPPPFSPRVCAFVPPPPAPPT